MPTLSPNLQITFQMSYGFCTSSSALNRLTNRFCYSGGDLKGTIGIGIDIVCDMEEEEAAKLLY